jgi:hypothetical protein
MRPILLFLGDRRINSSALLNKRLIGEGGGEGRLRFGGSAYN